MSYLEIFRDFHERRMSDNYNVHLVFEGEVKCRACAIAVAGNSQSGDSALLQPSDDLPDTGLGIMNAVRDKPVHQPLQVGQVIFARIEIFIPDGLLEEVGHDHFDAVRSVAICDELRVRYSQSQLIVEATRNNCG